MAIEISFPRGGRKPSEDAKPLHFPHDHDLFGHKRNKRKKTVKKGNVIEPNEEPSDDVNVTYIEYLSSKTIRDGMVLLGCIKEVKKIALEISLPNRLYGKVLVNNISKPYTKLLQNVVDQQGADGYKPLNELFSPGQCVAVNVLSLNDDKLGVTLSLMPHLINSNLPHSSVKPGMVLWGAISEIEDHGYVVDLGINNCRAFLKKENCEPNKEYFVGELLWFAVIKADVNPTATTIMLSAKQKKVNDMRIRGEISLDHLISGMQVDFTITKVLKNGLEGKFLNDYTGFIKMDIFPKTPKHKNPYAVDNVIQARIMCMTSVTKVIYLTLKSLDLHKREEVENGTLTCGKVLLVTPSGVYLKLKNIITPGFVSKYHAQKNKTHESFMDFTQLKRKYRKDTDHECRVLSYDYFEEMYICSTELSVTKKNVVFSLDNLNAGQTVSAEIKEIVPNGLVVKIENVNGFIKNEHICDSVLKNYNKYKSRFKVGQTIQARVWVINKEKSLLFLTMRPSLVNTDLILNTIEDAKKGQQYLGLVKQITTNGLLIQFFGDVHGWVPPKDFLFDASQRLDMLFKLGQLVKCTVVNCKKPKLTLSLHTSKEISEDIEVELKLGEHVTGIVTHITSDGIHVNVKDVDIAAFIPTLYLSKFPNFAPILQNFYKPGDEIPNLVYVSNNNSIPTLSLRDTNLSEDTVEDVKTLKKGTVLPCSVSNTGSNGVHLEAPILHFKNTVFVPKEVISNDSHVTSLNLIPHQYIYAKILNVGNNFDRVVASTKLQDVWDFDIQSAVQYFSEYINELLKIRQHFISLKSQVATLNLGEIVSGRVKKINADKSCVLVLDNGARAIVPKEHIKENTSVNDKVEAVVLFWDFENNVVEVASCPKLISRINQIQNANINIPAGLTNKSSTHAEVLLKKDNFILGVLRGAAGKRQLIFLPTKLHPNDLKPSLNQYVVGDYINIFVNKIENGIIIGLSKQLIKDINYRWKRFLILKRNLDEKSTEQPQQKRQKLNSISEADNTKKDETKKNKKKNKSTANNEETPVEIKKSKKEKISSVSEETVEIENKVEIKKSKKEKRNSVSEETVEIENPVKIKKSKKEKRNSISEETVEIENPVDIKKSKKRNSMSEETVENKNEKGRKKKNSISSVEDLSETLDETSESTVEKKRKKKTSTSSTDEGIEMDIKVTKKSKKEKKNNENNEMIEEISTEKQKKKKRKSLEEESNEPEISSKKSKQNLDDVPVLLPGADDFWNISENQENNEEESSEDEEPDEKELEKLRKKKKLTQAERAEAVRLEEERIRKIELELADEETKPKTPDQFDRLVLANPNNSMLWINYMAFHLEATEIEKARAVARKALNAIEFREEQEKMNVWIALLNLENRYGDKESFMSVLEDAVKMNDSLSIYLQTLNILADSKKIPEFLDLLKTVTKKFKQDFKMWTETAEACYNCDLKEEARNLMQRSLKSLDEKQHVNLLVKFAFMEARHNEPERSEALLEKVLASYPRRVDVWTSYVDMLIKGNRIHIARNVLERAICQKLPARKMKTLFSKYIQFETKYGDEESIKKVRLLATEYVKTALN